MSQMNNISGMGGPVGQMNAGTPNSSNGNGADPIKRLNTAIYDYLLRNSLYDVARQFLKSMDIETDMKKSPAQRGNQANGADENMEIDSKEIQNRPDDLPAPQQLGDGPFLQDWWCQFWEIYHGQRSKGKPGVLNYIGAQRQAQKARTNMMSNMDPATMQSMRAGYMPNMNNGMMPKAMQNPRNMQQMAQIKNIQANQQNQAISANPMERQGSQMDSNGPRSGSPGSGDAPSPKRQRMDGNMQQMNQGRPGPPGQMQGNPVGTPAPNPASIAQTQELLRQRGIDPSQISQQQLITLAMQPADHQSKAVETYSASMQQSMKAALSQANSNTNKGMPPNPNMQPGGQQGSPMSQAGLDGSTGEFYAAANGRMPSNAGAPGAQGNANGNANGGNHALQDYQMQLMLLEQQNKKRLLMARQEQDSMATSGQPGGNGGFAPGMSPQSRAGDPSPNPNDMQRGTPKIGKAGMSPNGDMAGRGSPQPGMMGGQGMSQQMRDQMMASGQMMRPPSSHPMAQMSQEQMRMFQQQQQQQGNQMMQNGNWQPGQQGPGQMMQGHPNMTPRQGNQMGPPPPPQSGTQPSSPSQQPAAPPTPSQANKAKPGSKKGSTKKDAAKKNAPNAAPASESEQPPTPTPATPNTPMNASSFGQKGGPNGQQAPGQNQPGPAVQQPGADMNPPFGNLQDGSDQFPGMNLDFAELGGGDVLDNFDFDSFLNTAGDGDVGLPGFDANFAFGDSLEAGGDMGN